MKEKPAVTTHGSYVHLDVPDNRCMYTAVEAGNLSRLLMEAALEVSPLVPDEQVGPLDA